MIVENFTGGRDASRWEIMWIKCMKANLWVVLDLSGTFAYTERENGAGRKNVSDYKDVEG